MTENKLYKDAIAEIHRLHRFFTDWFRARIDDREENFALFVNALGPGFVMIRPDGAVMPKDALATGLKQFYGQLADQKPAFTIEIRNERLIWSNGEKLLMSYEEWQRQEAGWHGRISSTLVAREPRAPGGVILHHVHETALGDE